MGWNDKQASALAKLTVVTRPDEIPCDDWLDLIAEYVDLLQSGQEIPTRLQPVQDHVEVCPECAEELAALLSPFET